MGTALALPPRTDSGLRAALASLGADQVGAVRRSQLAAIGVPRHLIESMLSAVRWRTLGPIVIVMHNGPLTHEQQLWAAVLNAGGLAALAARTAATGHGLDGWDADCIEILVTKGSDVPRGLDFAVKVHESRRFGPGDLHEGRLLPQVRIERALVDAATWSTSPRTACGLLAAGMQQRMTTPSRLRDELENAGKIRHLRLLVRALTDIEGGAQAMSEIDFVRFCRRHGLPRPVLQAVRVDSHGRRRYLDATFERRGSRPVRVEIDGALHLVVRTYWDDMSRGNELVIGNEHVLRFPSYVIYADDATALEQLRRALNVSDSQRAIAS